MSQSGKTILTDALRLPSNDRAALVDQLIKSLDKPDAALDERWLREAERRMADYRAGGLDAVDSEQVFLELGKPN
jgi:putative addiction module component (TIGR02574 family)